MASLKILKIDIVPSSRLFPVDTDPLDLPSASAPDCSASAFMNREAACREIARQNPFLSPPAAETRFVIGGQQAGLLTGPLYTFLKAVSAIRLAGILSSAQAAPAISDSANAGLSHPVLPLFWIAAEDHDLLEVNRVTIHSQRYVHPYKGELTRGRMRQVGSIPLDDLREPLIGFLREILPVTEYTPWVMTLLDSVDFSTYTSAFKSLLEVIFTPWNLRCLDPIASRFLTAPILADLVAQWPAVLEGLAAGAEELIACGLEAPLKSARIFEIVDGRRVPVDLTSQGGVISEGKMSLADLAEAIRRRPADFSPSAALRPICQDGAFPVAVTVGGPTELCYLRQILPIYKKVGIRPSGRRLRISATFIQPAIARAADKAGLTGASLLNAGAEPMTERSDSATESLDSELVRLSEISHELLAVLESLDRLPSPRWYRSGRASIEKGVNRITSGLREEAAAKANRSRSQLKKISEAVRPGGKPQERVINIVELLNRFGPGFVETVVESLDPLGNGHQLVYLGSREEKNGH